MAGAVAKTKKADVVEFDPSMFEADAGEGVSNMGQDDLALPFLKILSSLDPLLDELEDARDEDLAFVKIGFHVGPAGNQDGLGEWMRCLDAAGVPFFLKSADSGGQIFEAAQLKAASGVPHVLVGVAAADRGREEAVELIAEARSRPALAGDRRQPQLVHEAREGRS